LGSSSAESSALAYLSTGFRNGQPTLSTARASIATARRERSDRDLHAPGSTTAPAETYEETLKHLRRNTAKPFAAAP
jgi:hypothetical protein